MRRKTNQKKTGRYLQTRNHSGRHIVHIPKSSNLLVPKKKYIIDVIANFFSMFEFLIRL